MTLMQCLVGWTAAVCGSAQYVSLYVNHFWFLQLRCCGRAGLKLLHRTAYIFLYWALTGCGVVVPDVLQLWLDSSVLCVRRAAACCVSVLTHTWQVCWRLTSKVRVVNTQTDNKRGGTCSSRCGEFTFSHLFSYKTLVSETAVNMWGGSTVWSLPLWARISL